MLALDAPVLQPLIEPDIVTVSISVHVTSSGLRCFVNPATGP